MVLQDVEFERQMQAVRSIRAEDRLLDLAGLCLNGVKKLLVETSLMDPGESFPGLLDLPGEINLVRRRKASARQFLNPDPALDRQAGLGC